MGDFGIRSRWELKWNFTVTLKGLQSSYDLDFKETLLSGGPNYLMNSLSGGPIYLMN